VNSISESTYLLHEDIVTALKEMNVLNPKKRADGTVLASKAKVTEWAIANNVDLTPVVDPSALVDYPELETNMSQMVV
jgi:hypothetical protein